MERAVLLAATDTGSCPRRAADASLDELAQLVDAAGGEVVARIVQAGAAQQVGAGKRREVAEVATDLQADVVVFDGELGGTRRRQWEDEFGTRVVDRTQVILDVFARHATSVEGRLQVEAAQLRYMLPRLSGRTDAGYSRQRGRIGTRGPGETRLETDRRRIRTRLSELNGELGRLERERASRRERRRAGDVPVVALGGYTNVGKSTLFRQLSRRWTPTADALFVTLDPAVRRVHLPGFGPVLLVDTVGFVSHLPHELVAAFHSTLAEIAGASLIVVVERAGSPRRTLEREAVEDVLHTLGADTITHLVAATHWDLMDPTSDPDGIPVSGLTGFGMDDLTAAMRDALMGRRPLLQAFMPWDAGEVLGWILAEGDVVDESPRADGLYLTFRAPPHVEARVNRRLARGTGA
jgi:GTP-binding protein HflX